MTRTICLLTLALALTGCPAGDAKPKADAFDTIKERGVFIVALNAGYPPFVTVGDDGKPVGFDVDLATEVAADLGVKLEIKNVKWDGIIGFLRTGKADAIFSGMSVTEDRKKVLLFSEPYFNVGQVVLKRKGDDRIKVYTDLNNENMTIAVEASTTGEQACKKMLPKATLLRLDKVDQACQAMIQKKADAVVFDNAYLLHFVARREKDDVEGLWEQFTFEDIASAVRQDSPKLQAAINATLERLRESDKMKELLVKHFGEGAADKG